MGCSLIIAFSMVSQTNNLILSAAAVDFVGLIYLLIVAVRSLFLIAFQAQRTRLALLYSSSPRFASIFLLSFSVLMPYWRAQLVNTVARTDVTHIEDRLRFRSLMLARAIVPILIYFYLSVRPSQLSNEALVI